MKSIICLTIVIAASLMLSGCHTTRMGQSIGFPTPQERGSDAAAAISTYD